MGSEVPSAVLFEFELKRSLLDKLNRDLIGAELHRLLHVHYIEKHDIN